MANIYTKHCLLTLPLVDDEKKSNHSLNVWDAAYFSHQLYQRLLQ